MLKFNVYALYNVFFFFKKKAECKDVNDFNFKNIDTYG